MEGSIHVCYKERLMHPYWKQHTEKIYNSVDSNTGKVYHIKKYRIHILHTKIWLMRIIKKYGIDTPYKEQKDQCIASRNKEFIDHTENELIQP